MNERTLLLIPVAREHGPVVRGKVGLDHVEILTTNVLSDIVEDILADDSLIHASADEHLRGSRKVSLFVK